MKATNWQLHYTHKFPTDHSFLYTFANLPVKKPHCKIYSRIRISVFVCMSVGQLETRTMEGRVEISNWHNEHYSGVTVLLFKFYFSLATFWGKVRHSGDEGIKKVQCASSYSDTPQLPMQCTQCKMKIRSKWNAQWIIYHLRVHSKVQRAWISHRKFLCIVCYTFFLNFTVIFVLTS